MNAHGRSVFCRLYLFQSNRRTKRAFLSACPVCVIAFGSLIDAGFVLSGRESRRMASTLMEPPGSLRQPADRAISIRAMRNARSASLTAKSAARA